MTTFTEKWLKKIKRIEKKLKDKHRDFAEKAEKEYYNEGNNIDLPMWWSSVNAKAPTLYARPPEPEIRSRNKDVTNPAAKTISKLLEEVIRYEIDQSDFDSDAKKALKDFLITDLGVVRVRYDVDSQDIPSDILDSGYETVVTNQHLFIDHWPWKRFLWDIGKDWAECEWICYIHYMTKEEVKRQFKVDVSKLKFTSSTDDDKQGKVTIYEVWDKRKRKVYDLIEERDKPLRERDDPLRLKGFWDCPKPLIVNMRSDKYIPQSDFKMLHRQFTIINVIEKRIDALTRSIKYSGFHDKSFPELKTVTTLPDGKFAPIDGLMKLNNGAGVPDFSKALAFLPIEMPAQCIGILEQRKEQAKEQIFELTGVSDIQRGATKASETATAQQIKSNYGQVRLMTPQSAVNDWLRGIMRIYAELVAEKFDPDVLEKMTGVDVRQVVEPKDPNDPFGKDKTIHDIMKSDALRCYAIDVETDSSIQTDESQDKQDRMEMVNTMLQLLQTIIPAVNQNMMPLEMGKHLLLTAIRGFKYTRALEDMIEGMGDNMQQLQQLQQQLQQMDQNYQQQLMQANQYAGQLQQELGAAQKQLQDVNMREEQRKDIEVQAEAQKDAADVRKKDAETQEILFSMTQPSPSRVAMDQYGGLQS